MKPRVDWFLIGLGVATGLAFLFPNAGARGGALHAEVSNKVGVALIFFLHGAGLSFAALRSGTLKPRLHLLVQGTTFVAFPLLGLLLVTVLGSRVSAPLALGLFYLCALPSTVSSSVALTATAGGNVPGAVFNATLSSLLGVFATPLWVSLQQKSAGVALPLGAVIVDLLTWLVLPLVLGQLSRPLLGPIVERHKKRVAIVDRLTILMLVYTSFCDSVKSGVWTSTGAGGLIFCLCTSGVLLLLALTFVGLACDALHFSREDRIAAVFCGSKKTLASGVPMAQLMFGAHPGLGLILLPIMIYHPLQLIVCGWLATRWSRQAPDTA
ncbi:MAG TPA: bile acid:sodium symporter family protein [Polyangiaceae bacterium]|nr:bile acid:sodium symporter family protein [Polyangiaceae bacterium]